MSWELAAFGLLGLALIGGFAWWERSRPSSRTVALVATLAALATLGDRLRRAPSVKPTTDIVLIAGYTLAARRASRSARRRRSVEHLLRRGSLTPWQMLAWGLVGLARRGLARWRIPRYRWP